MINKVEDLRAMDMAERRALWGHFDLEERALLPSYEIHEQDAREIYVAVAALGGRRPHPQHPCSVPAVPVVRKE